MPKSVRIVDLKARLAQEQGTIRKDWGGRIPVALVYPNTYYVGMSSLGFQTIYKLFNEHPDVVCERAFLPDTDYKIEWRRNRSRPDLEVVGLESGRPLKDYAVVAFSVSYELDYFHIMQILRMAGIPLFAKDRDESHPLIIAGGACIIDNPEPIAPFLDVAVVGEGEVLLPPFIDELRAHGSGDREMLLRACAMHPGLYVPAFYDVDYLSDGRFAAIRPNSRHPDSENALPVTKQRVRNMNTFETTSVILTQDTEFGSSILFEVARVFARGCRFF